MNFYEIMGVSNTATLIEIKKAYTELSKKYHPDRNPGDDEAVKKFQQVQEAYEVLGDSDRRTEYDLHGHWNRTHHSTPGKNNFNQSASRHYKASQVELDSIQQQFFGGSELQGRNILIHLLLTSVELETGTTKLVKWKKGIKCDACDGYGAAPLTKSKFVKCKACKGTGNIMQIYGREGTVYPKCDFCDGSGVLDMHCKICNGTGITKDMLIEEKLIEVPAGTPSGFQLVIKGKGELGSKGGIPGNLHVVIIEQN